MTEHKKTEFTCVSTAEGGMDFGDYNRKLVKDRLKEDVGARWKLVKITPESNKQRKFFEGAVIPLACYFHEKLDHKNNIDCEIMREWLKIEWNGELLEKDGKLHKIGMSTKGKLGGDKGLIDKIIDDMEEQNGMELRSFILNEKEYKNWRDSIFPFGGPDTWIDYCISIKKL